MTKIIVISDSHGNIKNVEKLRPIIAENDILVHLGDGAGDIREIMRDYPEKVYTCAGNCDFFSPLPDDGVIEVERLRIYFCHGHKYRVKSTLDQLLEAAKRRDCDIALYGHTHNAKITETDGVLLINPGSLKHPAGEGGSYCYLVVHGDKATPVLVGESVR